MKPIHYVLIVGGVVAFGVVVFLLTRRQDPAPLPQTAGSSGGGDVGVAIAGVSAGLGSLFGSIAQAEINRSEREAAQTEA